MAFGPVMHLRLRLASKQSDLSEKVGLYTTYCTIATVNENADKCNIAKLLV
jgi:hypothetical protein